MERESVLGLDNKKKACLEPRKTESSRNLFFNLPGELRNQIYKLVFQESVGSYGLRPLLVNRQFYREAHLIAFGLTLFDLTELPFQDSWTLAPGSRMNHIPQVLMAKQQLLATFDEAKRRAINKIQICTRHCKTSLFRTLRLLDVSSNGLILRWHVLEHELWPIMKLEAENPIGLTELILRPYCARDTKVFHKKVLANTRSLNFWIDPVHFCGAHLLLDSLGRQYFHLRLTKSCSPEVKIVMEDDPASLLPLSDYK